MKSTNYPVCLRPERPTFLYNKNTGIKPGNKKSSYSSIAQNTFRDLVYRGKITKDICPVMRKSGGRTALINSSPVHPSGRRMRHYEYGGLYLNINFCAEDIVELTRWMLGTFGDN